MRHFGFILFILAAASSPAIAQSGDSWRTRSLIRVGGVSYAMWGHASASTGGFIYTFGGNCNSGYQHRTFRYDPVANSWAVRASIPPLPGDTWIGYDKPAGAALGGLLYQIGGTEYRRYGNVTTTGSPTYKTWRFDPALNSWSRAADLLAEVTDAKAVSLDDRIVMTGGRYPTQPTWTLMANHWWLDRAARNGQGEWKSETSLPFPLCDHHVGSNGTRVLVTGGRTTGGISGQSRIFDYANRSAGWKVAANLPEPVRWGAFVTARGRTYVIGGSPALPDYAIDSVQEYDYTADAWTSREPMLTARYLGAAATERIDGSSRIFFTGGTLSTDCHEYTPPLRGGMMPGDPYSHFLQLPDGSSLPEGAPLSGDAIVIGALISDYDSASIQLEAELTHVPTGTVAHWFGKLVAPGAATVTCTGLQIGGYQVRLRSWDTEEHANPHGWITFGTALTPDFFVDRTPPPAPVIVSPGLTDAEVKERHGGIVDLVWEAAIDPEGTAVTYDIEVSRDPWFTEIVASQTGLSNTSTGTWLDATRGTTYVWRVRGVDALGNSGAWAVSAPFAVLFLDTTDNGAGDAVHVCGVSATPHRGELGMILLAILVLLLRLRRRAQDSV